MYLVAPKEDQRQVGGIPFDVDGYSQRLLPRYALIAVEAFGDLSAEIFVKLNPITAIMITSQIVTFIILSPFIYFSIILNGTILVKVRCLSVSYIYIFKGKFYISSSSSFENG